MDELEALRVYLTPDPVDPAVVDAVRQQLEAGMATEPLTAPTGRARRYRSRWVLLVAAGAAGAAAAVVVAVVALAGPGGPPPPVLDAVNLTHFAAAPGAAPVAVGPWRQINTGPPGGRLTCSDVLTCYVTGGNGNGDNSGNAPHPVNRLYATNDGGDTWSAVTQLRNAVFTTGLACTSDTRCTAGAEDGHWALLLTTVDGGDTWTSLPVDDTGQFLTSLACPTTDVCDAVSRPEIPARRVGHRTLLVAPVPETFLRTTDGGHSWSRSSLPGGYTVTAMSCPTGTACVAVGTKSSLGPTRPTGAAALRTIDGGQTWATTVVSSEFDDLIAVSCPVPSQCWAIGQTSNSGSTEPLVTGDGGATWTVRALPSTIPQPQMSGLACPTSTVCWLSGGDAVPQTFQSGTTTVHDGGSAVIAVTTDAGRQWSKITFVVAPESPLEGGGQPYDDINEIECPSTDACIAMADGGVGDPHTPVYTDVTPAG